MKFLIFIVSIYTILISWGITLARRDIAELKDIINKLKNKHL